MDQSTLVESQIRDGQNLIDRLIENGIVIKAAAWVKESDGGFWYLYLVTPLVGKGGATTPAYRRINAVMRASPEPLLADPFQKKVFGPSESVGRALVDFQRRYPGRLPRWYDGTSLGGVAIEAAYVYPPPVLSAAQSD
jgi:hypothetical protein